VDKAAAERMLEFWKKDYAAYPYMAKFWIYENVPVINNKDETVKGYEVGVEYSPLD
jgi:hypothetical protein